MELTKVTCANSTSLDVRFVVVVVAIAAREMTDVVVVVDLVTLPGIAILNAIGHCGNKRNIWFDMSRCC